MHEPEPFEGWRAARERLLIYLREDDPNSEAAAFLERCPAVDGEWSAGCARIVFLCSKRDHRTMREDASLRDELQGGALGGR